MTLNYVMMAIILRYFAEFGNFRGQLRKSGWLAMNIIGIFWREASWSALTKHDGRAVLFAVAEFLVNILPHNVCSAACIACYAV